MDILRGYGKRLLINLSRWKVRIGESLLAKWKLLISIVLKGANKKLLLCRQLK